MNEQDWDEKITAKILGAFGSSKGAKNHQKCDPESDHCSDDFFERFWHPSTFKHMAWDVLQKSLFHTFLKIVDNMNDFERFLAQF